MAHEDAIQPCEFEDIFEMAAEATEDGVRPKQRTEAQWYRYADKGMVCLWEPGNRTSTKRISHWWVHPDHRNEGIGKTLFEHALREASESGVETVDIYVYDEEFIADYGFEHRPESSQAMDDAKYYVLHQD